MPNSKPSKEAEVAIAKRAEELFSSGYNCCESMIKASMEILELPLAPDTYLLGRFFRSGVADSGCICGALAGGVMMLGYLSGTQAERPPLVQQCLASSESARLSPDFAAKKFREGFVAEFGSTCCRVIRKQQSMLGRFRNQKCREITGFAAKLLLTCQNLQEE